MAFKSIGELAFDVLRRAERTAMRRALNFGGELSSREEPNSSPVAAAPCGTAPSRGGNGGARGMENGGSDDTPASVTLEGNDGERGIPRPSLHAVNGKRLPVARPHGVSPAPATGSLLLLMRMDDHSTMSTVTRSLTTRALR